MPDICKYLGGKLNYYLFSDIKDKLKSTRNPIIVLHVSYQAYYSAIVSTWFGVPRKKLAQEQGCGPLPIIRNVKGFLFVRKHIKPSKNPS
uniref:Nuclear transcription factor Y subunit A-3 n=1 Tax=Rhizophora mucronata TaxID=61149 RepID=A0A2P2ILY6_RHIMU